MPGSRPSVSIRAVGLSAMLFIPIFAPALATSFSDSIVRGFAASPPTAGPSKATGRLPALGYARHQKEKNIIRN